MRSFNQKVYDFTIKTTFKSIKSKKKLLNMLEKAYNFLDKNYRLILKNSFSAFKKELKTEKLKSLIDKNYPHLMYIVLNDDNVNVEIPIKIKLKNLPSLNIYGHELEEDGPDIELEIIDGFVNPDNFYEDLYHAFEKAGFEEVNINLNLLIDNEDDIIEKVLCED